MIFDRFFLYNNKQAYLCHTNLRIDVRRDLLGFHPKTQKQKHSLRFDYEVMMPRQLKTRIRQLRLTELKDQQLNVYLSKHGLNFSEFADKLIHEKLSTEFHAVLKKSQRAYFENKVTVSETQKVDPALLLEIGRIGNNLNQISKSLNIIKNSGVSEHQRFDFLRCLYTLQNIQTEIHSVLPTLPKITRSEQAIKNKKAQLEKKLEQSHVD